MNVEKKELSDALSMLYDRMSANLIVNLKKSKIDPNDVALESGISSEKMLELLFDNKKGDYLAYKEMDISIKRLVKKRSENEFNK